MNYIQEMTKSLLKSLMKMRLYTPQLQLIQEIGNMMKLSYPEKYFDVFSFMAEASGMTVGDVMGIIQGSTANSLSITKIISDEVLEDYDTLKKKLVEVYGDYQAISDYIDQNGGKDKIDFLVEYCEYGVADYDSENISLYFEPENAHIIRCNMASSMQTEDNGVTPQVLEYEQEFIIYYIEGEGWKMDTYSSD